MKSKIILSALALIFSVSLCAFAGGTVEQPPTYGDVVVTEKAQQPIFDVPGEYMITTYDVVQGVDFVMPVNQVTLRTDFVAETYNLTLSGFADACKDVMTFAQAHQRFRQANTYLFPDEDATYDYPAKPKVPIIRCTRRASGNDGLWHSESNNE